MDTVQRLIAAAVLALAGTAAHAGYAQAKPPPGFQPMPAAGPVTGWGYAKGANESFVNGTVRTTTSLNVGGRTITMPAAMRFAANAPRFAAAAIFASPHIRTAIGVATWLGAASLFYDEAQKIWQKNVSFEEELISKYEYRYNYSPWGSLATACNLAKNNDPNISSFVPHIQQGLEYASGCHFYGNGYYQGYRSIQSRKIPCPPNTTETPAGCLLKTSTTQPLTEEEFLKQLPSTPMPDTVPEELPPGTPLPVELPVINPAPGPLPATRPAPRPYFDPSGDPVPNPNYNPNAEPSPTNQPYIQPGIKIQPSPTPSEPWRVDVQPVQRPTDSEVPKTADELNPQPDPNTNPNEQPKDQPREDQPGLCELYPDILACQKLDTPEAKDLAREEVQISISPLGGWGAEDAACPAPKTAMVMGREVSLSWQPVCDFATGLRPLVIALAWLSAATMLIVVARRGNA